MANLTNLISLTTLCAVLLALCIGRGVQLLAIKVGKLIGKFIKRHTKTYADIKRRRSLDEWEQKFDDSNY